VSAAAVPTPEAGRPRTVLLTFATVSWQKGSAAQVQSLVAELRRTRPDLRFRLLSQCPELDGAAAKELGVEVVDPGFAPGSGRDRRSVSLMSRRLACIASDGMRRAIPGWRGGTSDPVARAYREADFVLDLSGDSYRDRPGGFAPAHHANLMAALAAGVPYGLVSQSLGPFRAPNRPVVGYLLSRAALIYIRERRTREILRGLGVPADRLELAPDVAFALEARSPEPIWAAEGIDPGRAERPRVAVSVSGLALRLSSRGRTNRYLAESVRLVEHIRSRYGASVFLVPHEVHPPYYGPDDRAAADELVRALGGPAWLRPIRGDHDASRLKGLIAQCDALVASRMHAAIAGLSSGVPTLMVSWSHKYRGVMDEIGLEGCVWDPEDPGADSIRDMFDRLWNDREETARRLRRYTAGARRQIERMGERIGALIPGARTLGRAGSAPNETRRA